MKALDARNKEAFNIDNGTVWSSGKVGDIFEDKFFYVPENFGWLGPQYKGVKSLVSGIGWKVTSIEGERFTRDLRGVSFKEKRLKGVNGGVQGTRGSLSTKLELEQVVYYDGEDKTRYELGEGTCAIEKNYGGRKVYLFVGFAEVEKGGNREGGGHEWNFLSDRFFSDKGKCEKLKGNNEGKYRLVVERIGREGTKDANKGDEVIVLGVGEESGKGILDFGKTKNNNHLIGVLMGVAINLSWVKNCDSHFDKASKNDSRDVTEELMRCINTEREQVKGAISDSKLKIKSYEGSGREVDVKAELIEERKEIIELKVGNAGKGPFKGDKTSRELKYKYE